MDQKRSVIKVKPSFAERVWGKTDLRPWYVATEKSSPVGEAWLTGPECLTESGETLKEAWGADFPLLIKMLFPAEKLSVQVHPNDEEAQLLGLERGKTECWYALEVEPGAAVACGLKEGTTVAQLESAIAAGKAENLLQMIPVEVGDMIFVDAGTVHAIGPGVTLLEVQQTCDVTYRLYDYDRPRELHLRQGLAVVKTKTQAGKVTPRRMDGFTRLIETPYFIVDRFDLSAGASLSIAMPATGCLVCLAGIAEADGITFYAGEAVVMHQGGFVLSTSGGCAFVRCSEPAG